MDAIRIGYVTAVDKKNGMVNVLYEDSDDEATGYLPYLTFASEYKMPKVKDMVLVAHLSNGTVSAVVIGGFWNKGNVPDVNDGTVWKKMLSDDSFMEFDGTVLKIHAPRIVLSCNDGSLELNSFLKGGV